FRGRRGSDHLPQPGRRGARAGRGHGRARGLHPPDPPRRRARAGPPGPAGPHARADDAGRGLRPAHRDGLRPAAGLLPGRRPPAGGPPPRSRGRVAPGGRAPLELEEPPHAGMAARYAAGAASLPFGVLRGYAGTDLPAETSSIATVTCPFTGEELAAVAALRPDVGVIHAQQADEAGNVQLWGIVGVQKEAVLASERSIVTVEEIVPELEHRPGGVVIPTWAIDAVALAPGGAPLAPGGAHPSSAHGYYDRDNAFYVGWDGVSRDRERFLEWMERHVQGTADVEEYHRSIAGAGA